MVESRISVQSDFPLLVKTDPQILYIDGQPEWVDSVVTFGDLIESKMGNEARDFYFENLYKLLHDASLQKDTEFEKDDGKNYVEDKVADGASIVVPKPHAVKKQKKTGGRRLF